MGCGSSTSANSGNEPHVAQGDKKKRKKDSSAGAAANNNSSKNGGGAGGAKGGFRGIGDVQDHHDDGPISSRAKSTAAAATTSHHHQPNPPLVIAAAAESNPLQHPPNINQQQRAMSIAQAKSMQNPTGGDVAANVLSYANQGAASHVPVAPQAASAPVFNPAAGAGGGTPAAVSEPHTPAVNNAHSPFPPAVPAPQPTAPPLPPPPSAADATSAAAAASRKLTFRQSIHLALDLAKQQRAKYGKFRKDERRAVMELYEVLGLEEDKPLAPPSEFQNILGCYRFPPPNMHMLREVETADVETIEYMLGPEEAKRRRETGTLRIDVRSTGTGTDAKRRVGVSGETTTSIKKNAFKSIPKTAQQTDTLTRAMAKSVLFRGLDSRDLRLLFDAFEEEVVPADGVIFEKGDEGDRFYLIESGRCCILLDPVSGGSAEPVDVLAQSTGPSRHAIYVGDGDTFGELGVMYGTPRAATVIAVVETKLWFIDRDTYRGLLLVQTLRKRDRYNRLLESIALFQSLEEYEKTRIADVLETKEVAQGTPIVNEGDTGDSFYMIEEGEVQVSKHGVGVVSRLVPGPQGYFGELALLFDQTRAATVTAVSPVVRLAVLSRTNFRNYLGPFEDILKRNTDQYKIIIERLQQQQLQQRQSGGGADGHSRQASLALGAGPLHSVVS